MISWTDRGSAVSHRIEGLAKLGVPGPAEGAKPSYEHGSGEGEEVVHGCSAGHG